MEDFRANPIKEMDGIKLLEVIDYKNDETGLLNQMLKPFFLVTVLGMFKTMGTEPKIKLYLFRG